MSSTEKDGETEHRERDESLHATQETLRQQAQLLDLAQDAILINDLGNRITFWNPAAAELYGWSQVEAIGQIAYELLQTRFPDGSSFPNLQEALEQRGHWEGELVHTTRSGALVTVSSRWALRRDEEDQPLEWLEINRDVTASKRTLSELQEARVQAEMRTSLLETVNRVALHILSSQTGIEALHDIAEAARSLTGAQYAAFGVANTDAADGTSNISLQEFVTVGMTPEEEARVGPLPEGRGILGLLLRRSEPLRIDRLSEHPDAVGFPPNHPPMDSFLGVPVRHDDTVVGSLYLTNKENGGTFTGDDIVAVEALGAHAAVAVQNLHLRSRQRALVSGLFAAQEEERRAVAYDLHDGLTQYVMAAHARLESYQRARDGGKAERAAENFAAGMQYLKESVAESRRLVNGLRTLTLDNLGLAGALAQLLNEEKSRAGWVEVDFVHNVAKQRYDTMIETAIYRVAQEALTNVRKHADTRLVRVQLLVESKGEITLEVRDWGKGFVPEEKVGDYSRVGLQSMAARISLAGGSYELRSAPGNGTTIRAILPIIAPALEN